MAQFTSAERINAAFKQVFRILGTSNTDDALGKRWYEELYSSIGTVLPRHQWSEAAEVTFCSSLLAARALAAAKPAIVEDRSQPLTVITLTQDMTSNGRLWIARETPGDENSAILGDWIQPNDFPNAAGQPSNGFACVLYDGNDNVITATEGAWVPFYPLGAIILGVGQVVGQGELAGYVAPLKVGVFRYVGLKGGAAPTAPSAASFVRDEYPVVFFNGQTDFELDWSPAPDSLEVSVNGKLCTAGVDYTLVGRQFTWLNPFNPTFGVNVPLKTTDLLNFWYVNGAVRRGVTKHVRLPVTAPGQTVFTLPTEPLQNQHLQLYLNGQRCRPGLGAWYTISGTTITWLNPVVFWAPLGLTLDVTDVLTVAYIESADLGESAVKRSLLPVTVDGQTLFTVPAPDDQDSAKLYVNGQFQTLGVDWQWNTSTQIQWLDPIDPFSGLPLTLVTTDELQFIADNVGARCCGAQRFPELEDVPSSYVGQAGRVPVVNPTEDGLVFAPVILFRVRALVDPLGGGDYTTIMAALGDGADKIELKPNRVFNERVVISRSDVDILGYANSVVSPPVGDGEAFVLDGSIGTLYRLRFAGFTVQMQPTHPNNFCAFRAEDGNLQGVKFKDMTLSGYLYYPGTPIDASCGISFAGVPQLIDDVEVSGCLFQNWEYSCFTMWGGGGVRNVRVSTCMLKNYRTFGMDWYIGCSEIMINNNNFDTIFEDTPIGIAIPGTKSLFINGDNRHITFQNNTFKGPSLVNGSAVVISGHAGTPLDTNIECNTMRGFKTAIYLNNLNGRVRIVGNANDESSDNADGLFLSGAGAFIIGLNTVNV